MSTHLRIVADENIPGLRHAFADSVNIEFLAGRDIQSHHLLQADILLVRSVTRVNEKLLSGTAIKFVGTATIGLDHIDMDYLNESGIGFAYAPGSNAQSVVEYVLAAMAYWLPGRRRSFQDLTVGIVGVGRIGGMLQRYLEHMGVTCLLCDPPRQAAQAELSFYSLQQLSQADVISFHVPLITTGPWPTRHMIDVDFLSSLSDHQLLINSARGDILDNQMALQFFQDSKTPVDMALDVWQSEPRINAELIEHCSIATPHIAGYAIEGKWRATLMLCQALADYFNISINRGFLDKQSRIKKPWLPQADNDLVAMIQSHYPIRADDQALRNVINKLPQSFDLLRKNYPIRHEFLAPLDAKK